MQISPYNFWSNWWMPDSYSITSFPTAFTHLSVVSWLNAGKVSVLNKILVSAVSGGISGKLEEEK